MFLEKQPPKLTMGEKLKMFRTINEYSQDEIGQKLNVSDKTISAWETGERDINLENAKAICELFNIPNTYFIFDENFNNIDCKFKEKILNYIDNSEFRSKIEKIINQCKIKLEKDGLQPKKTYLPNFDFGEKNFKDFGIFDQNKLPIKIVIKNSFSALDAHRSITFDEKNIDNEDFYLYSSEKLVECGLLDILQKYNSNTVELKDLKSCNDLDFFKKVLNKMRQEKYYSGGKYLYDKKVDITEQYIQTQLNEVLEELNPNISKFWEIIVYLIDNGAYYTKQIGHGSECVSFCFEKDVSKTNIIYRMAKDKSK